MMVFYPTEVDNALLMSSILCFVLFVFHILVARTASGKSTYTRVGRIHVVYGLILLVLDFSFVWNMSDGLWWQDGIAILVSLWIYMSLYYVFLFSLIALSKKSVSMNVLVGLFEKGGRLSSSEFRSVSGDRGIDFVRDDRLFQMIHLKFAQEEQQRFYVLPRGRWANAIGGLILRCWGGKRG